MKKVKKLTSVLLAVLIFCLLPLNTLGVSAAEKSFKLSLSTISGIPGETVVVSLNIVDNPGIYANTFTVHYDPNVLEYQTYIAGILKKDTSKKHNGYVSIVNCESGSVNKTGDGALYGFEFKIKENAPAGFTEVTIKNIMPSKQGNSLKGCFANLEGDKLMPEFTAGGVTVGYTMDNHSHKYEEWQTVVEAYCNSEGVKTRSCEFCSSSETGKIEPKGHSYGSYWTIDVVATEDAPGQMTRHCQNFNCNSTSDTMLFTVNDAKANGFANNVGTVIKANSWKPLKDVIDKEQKDKKPTEVIPEKPIEIIPEEIESEVVDDKVTAEELVQIEKKEDTFFVKLYTYLFGSEKEDGFFDYLFGLNFFEKINPLYIVLVIFGILF